MRRKRYWVIEGYDGSRRIFSKQVSIGHFNDRSIRLCLQALCATVLSPKEIIGAYVKRGGAQANNLLDVHLDLRKNTYQCGDSRHFTARRMDIAAP